MSARRATPGFWDWSFDPPLVLVIAFAILYWIGSRRTASPERTKRERRWRSISFYAGLAVVVVALSSPLDALSEQLFWVHMVQHVLLLVVAAAADRPGSAVGSAVALPAARHAPIAGPQPRSGRADGPSAIGEPLSRAAPPPASWRSRWCCWAGTCRLLFDATLRSGALHALEHTLFFGTALMFWKQVIPSPPLRVRLADSQRVLYAVGAMIVSWVLAVVLALAPHPLYGFYAHEASRPGGISAIADQQLAAGIMWVPGSITFLIVIFVYVHRWLMPPAPGPTRAPRLASEH